MLFSERFGSEYS